LNKSRVARLLAAAFVSTSVLLPSCQKPSAEASFYFWRTKALLSPGEREALNTHKVSTLYVRLFDVDTKTENGRPEPLGVIDSLERLPAQLTVIPVVFITNRTFLRLKADTEAMALAGKVLKKVHGLRASYPELQIDCDWSDKTKARYFLFLQTLKQQLPSSTKLTATIRLHQIKYPVRTGVPPVDGGMLMFYNMGNLQDAGAANSIFDASTASAYTPYLKSYALHLDAALPIFRWYVHYRNGVVKGLVTKKQLPEVADTSYFYSGGEPVHTLKKAAVLHGVSYEAGDVLKYEAIDDDLLLQAAGLLQKSLPIEHRRLVLYDLDDINLHYYENKTLQQVYSAFR
jgi:hypothetical protein